MTKSERRYRNGEIKYLYEQLMSIYDCRKNVFLELQKKYGLKKRQLQKIIFRY